VNQLRLVGDYDQRETPDPVKPGDQVSDQMEATRIQGRGGLVQEEDLWTAEEGSRNGDPLLLSAGEFHGIAVEKRLVQAHLLHGVDERGLRKLWLARTAEEVLSDRPVKHHRILKDQGNASPDFQRIEVLQRLSVKTDLSLDGIVEPVEKPEQGGFPGAGRASNAEALPRLHLKGDRLENPPVGLRYHRIPARDLTTYKDQPWLYPESHVPVIRPLLYDFWSPRI
jgi:hypothetical protein